MSVKKEPSGRRSVEVEFQVPGTLAEVWQAIATGRASRLGSSPPNSMSAWAVP